MDMHKRSCQITALANREIVLAIMSCGGSGLANFLNIIA